MTRRRCSSSSRGAAARTSEPGSDSTTTGSIVDLTIEADRATSAEGDCGIYNVGTLEHARRQGVGSAVTSVLVHDAIGRGCRTASLQSTPTAERMYAAAGFRDLGRIIEYVPAQTSCGLTSR